MDAELRVKELEHHFGRIAIEVGKIQGDLMLYRGEHPDESYEKLEDDPLFMIGVDAARIMTAAVAIRNDRCEHPDSETFECVHEWSEGALLPIRSCDLCWLEEPSTLDPDLPEGKRLHRAPA
ncbi:hypothetical protein LCGC14_0443830 [marine sediment metagenome]|uniref:Uncharacterized protein n=1 Tax=marine sediment metagenome TaxID=412755 RepID=A0A0F9T2Y3_9ZZZZ